MNQTDELYKPFLNPPKTWLTVEEVAQVLSIHPNTVFRAIKSKELIAERMGKGYRIYPDAIEKYRERRRTQKDRVAA